MDISIQRKSSNGVYIPLQEQSFLNPQLNQANPQPNIIQQMPILQSQNHQIISNQMAKPQVIYLDTTNFKTSPCNTFCPFCKNQIQTRVNTKCNWCSFIFCCWSGIFTWLLIQCCRNKQIICCDAEHFCPVCGNKIADYTSC